MFSINKIPTINSKYVDCCRLCLVNNDTLESYHTQDSGEMSYFVKISGIMPSLLNNSSELLPQSICKQCREKLNVSYDFIINCFNTNKVLNQYVKDVTSETSANDTTSEEISSSNKETNENNNHTVSFLIFKNNFVKAEPSIVFSGTDFSCFNPLVNKEIDLEAAKTIVDPLLANTEQINELSYQGIKIGDENTTQFEDVSVKMEKPPEIDLPSTSTSTSTSTADTQTKNNFINIDNESNSSEDLPDVENPAATFAKDQDLMDHINNMLEVNIEEEEKDTGAGEESLAPHFLCETSLDSSKDPITTSETKNTTSNASNKTNPLIPTKSKQQADLDDSTCPLCKVAFKSLLELNLHRCPEETSHFCKTCNKRFTSINNLRMHERSHDGRSMYPCAVCNKGFSSYDHLKRHNRIHEQERPFLCQTCGKTFNQSCSLKVHERIHSGERPYKCEFCGKSFMDTSGMNQHRRIHTGERPYVCSVCNKNFRTTTGLRGHEKVHENQKTRKRKTPAK